MRLGQIGHRSCKGRILIGGINIKSENVGIKIPVDALDR